MNDFEAINNKVRLLYIKIEDAEFDKAYELAENILLSNPENPDAYIAKLLCELKCHSLKELESVDVDFSSNPNFKRAMMYSSEETQKILSECLNKAGTSAANFNVEQSYISGEKLLNSDSLTDLKKAEEIFSSNVEYKNSAELLKEAKYKLAMKLATVKDVESLNEAMRLYGELGGYKDSTVKLQNLKNVRMPLLYERAKSLSKSIDIKTLEQAKNIFLEFKNYKDSSKQVKKIEKKITRVKFSAALVRARSKFPNEIIKAVDLFEDLDNPKLSKLGIRIAKRNLWKRTHKIQYRLIKIGIILAILLAIIVAIVILSFSGLFLFSNWFTNTRFNEAEALYEAGDYMTVYEMTQNNYLPPDSSRTKELASKCLSALCYSQFEEAFNQDDYTLAYERYFILKEAGFDCYEQEAQDIFNQLNDIAVNGEDLVDLRYGKKVLFGSINGELLAWDVVYVDRNTNRAVLIAREDISTYKRLTSNTCEFEYPEWYMGSNNEIETEGFYSNCFSSFTPNDEKYLIYNEETQSYFFEPSKTDIRKYITNMHYVFDIEPSEHSIWLCPEINEDTNDITYYYFDTESESVEEWSTSDQLNRGMRPMIWVNYTSTNN